jgi:hypothetical protein
VRAKSRRRPRSRTTRPPTQMVGASARRWARAEIDAIGAGNRRGGRRAANVVDAGDVSPVGVEGRSPTGRMPTTPA